MQEISPAEPATGTPPVTAVPHDDETLLDDSSLAVSPMLPYVRMVVSLIEGIALTCVEVLDLLRQALRQHSIGMCPRGGYLWDFLHRKPP